MSRRVWVQLGTCIAAPVLALVLWLVSGREHLTKRFRIVPVQVSDDLFGGTDVVHQDLPGPIFGYYIGSDIVLGSVLLALAGVLLWWFLRRNQNREKGHEHTMSHPPRPTHADDAA